MGRRSFYTEEFYATTVADSLSAARIVVPVLLELLHPRSVVDFGCGEGAWLSVWDAHGLTDLLGLDGVHINRERLLISASRFKPVELEHLKPLTRTFDLALCLEVAEHLKPAAGDKLVENLTQAAPVVVFSAAVPGQGGTHHINEQFLGYWIKRFRRQGFNPFDVLRPRFAYDHRVVWWYRQNLILFANAERGREIDSQTEFQGSTVSQEWIHERSLAGLLSLKQTLRRLPRSVWRAVMRMLWKRDRRA